MIRRSLRTIRARRARVSGITRIARIRRVGSGWGRLLRTHRNNLIRRLARHRRIEQLILVSYTIHIGHAQTLSLRTVSTRLSNLLNAFLQIRVIHLHCGEGDGDRPGNLTKGDALDAKNRDLLASRVSAIFDADAVILVQSDALGIQNRGDGQAAIGSHRLFTIPNHRNWAWLVNNNSTGQLLVHVSNIDCDFHCVFMRIVKVTGQLACRLGNRPVRNLVAVNVECDLEGFAYLHHRMVAQPFARTGNRLIVGFEIDALFIQELLQAGSIGHYLLGFAVHFQCDRLAGCAHEGGCAGGKGSEGCNCHSPTPVLHKSARSPLL